MAVPIITAAVIHEDERPFSRKKISAIVAVVEARETMIKVLRPAEWRLLDLSQPMTAESTRESAIRRMMEAVLSSEDQLPRSSAIKSFDKIITSFFVRPYGYC